MLPCLRYYWISRSTLIWIKRFEESPKPAGSRQNREIVGGWSVGIGLREKTSSGPIICRKIEHLRKKRLLAGKLETVALEPVLSVIRLRRMQAMPAYTVTFSRIYMRYPETFTARTLWINLLLMAAALLAVIPMKFCFNRILPTIIK